VRETEPNREKDQAGDITPPVRLQGRFELGGDRDLYRLDVDAAHAGQTFVVDARSRALGSPCDLWMEWQSERGEFLRRLKPDAEGVLTNVFKEVGVYYLVVEELSGMGHADNVYELDARWWEPGFRLAAESEVVEVRPGKAGRLKVKLEREGYEGPVRLEVNDRMVALKNALMEGDAKEVTLEIEFSADAASGAILEFRVEGVAEDESGVGRRGVSTLPALRKRFGDTQPLPPGLDGLITLVMMPGESSEP